MVEIRFFGDVTTKRMMHYKNIKKAIEFKLLEREMSIDRCGRLCFCNTPIVKIMKLASTDCGFKTSAWEVF